MLQAQDFVHPGILHKESDFARMRQKIAEKAEPWYSTWNNLLSTPEAGLGWNPRAVATVIRGGTGDNISLMYRDVAAAYQHALIYKISGDVAHGNKAAQILNAWSLTNKSVSGNADRYLAAGLNGYQFANAAEMMRGFPGFDLERFKKYMMDVFFYPMNERFLIGNAWGAPHNDACATNYRVNWDACNMNAMLAISILCDHKVGFNEALNYFKSGDGTGNITRAVNFLYPDKPSAGANIWGQWEESGRDQGHAVGGLSLYGLFCEIAWNQGVDMYGYDNNRFRKGAEYVARYNILENGTGKYNDLPYTTYSRQMGSNCAWYTETALGASVRGKSGAAWETIYNHYARRVHQGDKVRSLYEITKNQAASLKGWPSTAIHADTYDTPGGGSLTFLTDSGNVILPWQNMDINARSIAKLPYYGSTNLQDSTLTVSGSGTGIKGNSDQFQYGYQKLVDDGSIETRINSFDAASTLAQAGIMIREQLEQNSAHVFLSVSSVDGTVFSAREGTGLSTNILASDSSINTYPYWVRLSRLEDTFIAAVSPDRKNWTEIGRKIIKMNRQVYAGVAVSSNNSNVLSTSVFENTSLIQGNIRPVVQLTSPSLTSTLPFVSPANIKIAGNAYDMDGLLDKSEIYVNDSLVSTARVSTFTFSLSAVAEGKYTVLVKSYDKTGAVTVCDTARITVNAPTDKLPWYKFDETKLMYYTVDANGNALNGLLYGGVTFVPGKINNSAKLDGVDDYIKIPNGIIEKLSDFTVSTWVYADTVTTWSRIFDFGSGTTSNMFLTSNDGTGKMKFSLSGSNISSQSASTTSALPAKAWTYVTVTLSANKLSIYINGVLKGTGLSFMGRPYDLGATTANYIGKSQYTADPFFKGKIDDFRIYNYAMSVDEIKAQMAWTPVDKVKENTLMFYPNPAQDVVHFTNAENTDLQIYDMMGKVVVNHKFTAIDESVDVSRLSSGIYILKTTEADDTQHQNRLIIK